MSSASFQRKLESRGQWAEHFVSERQGGAIYFATKYLFALFNYHCTPHQALGIVGKILVIAPPQQ